MEEKKYTESDIINARYESHAKGLKNGREHQAPSPPTEEFMKYTKETFDNMQGEIKEIKNNTKEWGRETVEQGKDIEHIKESQVRIESTMKGFIEKADACYASKENVNKLEKFVTKVFWTALTSLIGFLVAAIWFLIDKLV